MSLVIFASELAACIGLNKYKSVNDAKIDFWKRLDVDTFKEASERVNIYKRTSDDIVNTLSNNVKVEMTNAIVIDDEKKATLIVEKVLDKPVNILDKDKLESITKTLSSGGDLEESCLHIVGSKQIIEKLKALDKDSSVSDVKMVIESVKVKDVEEVRKSVVSSVNTKRGVRNESSGISSYESSKKIKLYDTNDKFHKTQIGKTPIGTRILIGGRVDGLTDDKVVEIKCRRNRFFYNIPIYEKVQLHAYMKMTGRLASDLTQKYNGDVFTETHDFDNQFWDDICESALKFAIDMEELFESENLQDELLLM